MTQEKVFEALKKELSEESGCKLFKDDLIFEAVKTKEELEKYYRRYNMADEDTENISSRRRAPRSSWYGFGIWTLSDSCGKFVAVAHVCTVWNGEQHIWKGEVEYLDK